MSLITVATKFFTTLSSYGASFLFPEYDPNPLLTLEKKHRKRRHSSATGTSGGCTGDHEEPDCGEPYCAKMGKLEEDEEDNDEGEDDDSPAGTSGHHHTSKMLYWTWSGLGFKKPKSKKDRNKEFFHGIQRGNEVIKVGDAALFISTGNERPFIGKLRKTCHYAKIAMFEGIFILTHELRFGILVC